MWRPVAILVLAAFFTATAAAEDSAPSEHIQAESVPSDPAPGPVPLAPAQPNAAQPNVTQPNVTQPDPVPPIGAYSAAIARWQTLAARGDADAALQLGMLYDTGRGVPQDFAAAEQWYRKAADAGSAAAAFNLGTLYDSGRRGGRDAVVAYRWYRVSAERGFARAAYVVGVMTETGDGVAADPAAAAKWYRRAASGGVGAARSRLAAIEAASKASTASSRPAMGERQFASAVAEWREKGLAKGGARALASLQAAAAEGYPLAEYDLAYAYEHGVGVAPDPVQAYEWYQLAEQSDGAPALRAAAAANRIRIGARLSDEVRQSADRASSRLLLSTGADH